ncbi:hypothetical protein DLR11_25130 [Salmonella enterica subsp. salamae]|uniref:DUF4431 domain-containing protein n=1 Tax=Salmonella enterica subsp. salamae TaxID=59202 RepID=A0A5Y3V907_SALER|nr:DUF4431 domain-containing protein [Salmonella enterica subsp. salamae]EDH0696622.1 DUF4431 domain-containing protein [Salmonella enterica]EHM1753555.1 DUF4431 domain-containing protein [Salmonella enterica subsp. salamae serovar 40:c:e,n,x,z15]HCM2001482.1 DUF4431 domain-containing protein [Salmonella enterica subsp. salamae serovar [1],40:z35:e,n,x,z15]ECI3455016.1 hypothetical protein [Salmonella enterica subsp. salamae]
MFVNVKLYLLPILTISFLSYGACINDRDKITVSGNLSVQNFPGPPNFESVNRGDEKISVFMLHVDKGSRLDCVIDTTYSGDKINSDSKGKNWNEFMEIIPGDKSAQYEKLIGARVSITGYVFLAASPYHYTPALIYHMTELKRVSER